MELLLRDKEAALQQTTAKDRERKKVYLTRRLSRVCRAIACAVRVVCRACRV
jgi:hypothetical protein